jgi:uncharacterized RDD family membrane protein YckC
MNKRQDTKVMHLRILAFIIDVFIINLFFFIIAIVWRYGFDGSIPIRSFFNINEELSYTQSIIFPIIVLFSVWIYTILMIGKYQGTIGKLLLKIRVVGKNGVKISYGLAAYREIVGITISAGVFLLGFIWAFFDEYNQAWHDKLAKTYVIKEIK